MSLPKDHGIVCRPHPACKARAQNSGSRPSAGTAGSAAPARRGRCRSCCPPARAAPAARRAPTERARASRRPLRPPGTARPHAGSAQKRGRPPSAEPRPAASAPQRWEGAAAEPGPQVPVAAGAAAPTPEPASRSRPPPRRLPVRTARGSRVTAVRPPHGQPSTEPRRLP